MPYRYGDVEITWLGHDSFLITYDGKRIYIDPYKIDGKGEADIVLITHEHFDHLSIEDLEKIVSGATQIIAAEQCKGKLEEWGKGVRRYVKPGDRLSLDDVKVEAVPAYNLTKFKAPGVVFHPKDAGGVGYVVEVKGVRIYHAGDTDFIPEMRELKVDVALVPVSGTFVMTADEAARAVNTFKPKVAIPMHYGAIVGTEGDARKFKELAEVEVVILQKE